MTESRENSVPKINEGSDPYMLSLYKLIGVEMPPTSSSVMDAAQSAWSQADGVGERVYAVEALMGRRIDGQEIHELPFELVGAIFEGDAFDVAVRGVQRALGWDQSPTE